LGGLERGAVYAPGHRRSDRALAGPDEDAFTLASAALESLAGVSAHLPPPSVLHLVGEFPLVVEWGFPALLGHSLDLVRHTPDVAGLREAIDGVTATAESGPALLVALDLPEPPNGSALAVALRFGATMPTGRRPLLTEGGPAAVARHLLRELPGSSVAEEDSPLFPPPLNDDKLRSWLGAPLDVLSEGAYVPRARYLENLPSRWRLEGQRCGSCGTLTFPSRGRCRSCGLETGLLAEALPRDGARVVAATTIGKGGQPTEFDGQVEALGEYSVVLAEFAPGVRLTLQVSDAAPGTIPIGAPIGTRLRRLYPMEGEWRYGRKAVPLPAPRSG